MIYTDTDSTRFKHGDTESTPILVCLSVFWSVCDATDKCVRHNTKHGRGMNLGVCAS